MKFPDEPNFPKTGEDSEYLNKLSETPISPIFIMGLHRSGTTFLYDSISRCFPVANLDLYNIFYYDRLLKNHFNNNEENDRTRLNRAFRSLGITDRKLDAVWVDDSTVEEYGWLLRNESYRISIQKSNKDKFGEICQKLLFLNPDSKSVLLKNPWDTGNAKQILEWFPNARFIYITRDPIYILNSQVNAFLSLTSGSQFFQIMLIDKFKIPGGKVSRALVYAGWKVLRAVKAVVGDPVFAFFTKPVVAFSLQGDLKGYYNDIKTLPKNSVYSLSYGAFNQDPVSKLKEIQKFLNLPFVTPAESIHPKPRKGQIPESLKKQEPALMKRLRRTLGHSAEVDPGTPPIQKTP